MLTKAGFPPVIRTGKTIFSGFQLIVDATRVSSDFVRPPCTQSYIEAYYQLSRVVDGVQGDTGLILRLEMSKPALAESQHKAQLPTVSYREVVAEPALLKPVVASSVSPPAELSVCILKLMIRLGYALTHMAVSHYQRRWHGNATHLARQ